MAYRRKAFDAGRGTGDPKKKEAEKLISINEGEWDNNLLDFYNEGNMAKTDSVRSAMMDRYDQIKKLGYKDLADDSLPYNALTSMQALEKYKKQQAKEEAEYRARTGK